MSTEAFGDRLARLRGVAGLSQQALADKTGIALGTIRNWEQGRSEPGATAVVGLAAAIDADPLTLLGLDGGSVLVPVVGPETGLLMTIVAKLGEMAVAQREMAAVLAQIQSTVS